MVNILFVLQESSLHQHDSQEHDYRMCKKFNVNTVYHNQHEILKVMEVLEKLLAIWIDDQHHHWVLLSLILVYEKAKSLFSDLQARCGNAA